MKQSLWNILLFFIIFPYLIIIKKSQILTIVVYSIIVCHIYILYKTKVVWSVYAEYITILFGCIFIYEGYYTTHTLLICFGLLIIYGHVKKIIYPNKPYYFDV